MSKDKLKTKYKYVYFSSALPIHQSAILWICQNNRDKHVLGCIEYYTPWKQHIIDFKEGCIFNNRCLKDIAEFLEQLNRLKGGVE